MNKVQHPSNISASLRATNESAAIQSHALLVLDCRAALAMTANFSGLKLIIGIHALFLLLTLLSSLPSPANASTFDNQHFAKIPIQHKGRIKPLDSFARHLTQRLNGTDHIGDNSAIELLSEALFNPAKTINRPLFNVRDQDIRRLLKLPNNRKTFSLSEVIPALQAQREMVTGVLMRDDKTWGKSERALVTLHDNATEMRNLVKSLHFILPLKFTLPKNVQDALGIEDDNINSYLDLKRYEEKLTSYVKTLPEDQITDDLKAFIFQMSMIEENAEISAFLRIMPPEWPVNQSKEWQSPWTLVNSGLSGPESKAYLDVWKDMSIAYRSGDVQKWLTTSQKAYDAALNFQNIDTTPSKLSLEVTYQYLNPYLYSLIFYALAGLIAVFMLINPALPLSTLTFSVLLTGALFHSVAVILRVLILERPPVSTLYESVIFVSLICVITALLMAWMQQKKNSNEANLSLFIGALCGALFYFVGGYLAKDGDTLEVLVAVLNTNFWLATHVIIITAGYGFCVITALLAHFYLMTRAFGKTYDPLIKTTLTLALISLLFTCVGTILGGIWADQSWGRFWGWDPKENGALLIVLWLIWLIHGRIAGQLKALGFMAGMALLNAIVALAWFGVNLLGVGLHSYGFINGIAWSLGLFCAFEVLFVGACALLIKQRETRHAT